jgi:hypothetical protein
MGDRTMGLDAVDWLVGALAAHRQRLGTGAEGAGDESRSACRTLIDNFCGP